jgi:hypothetical protein
VAEDLLWVIERFADSHALARRPSYKALVTIFGQQCELSGGKVLVKDKTSGDRMQNPSDPDATYDGHKGVGGQRLPKELVADTHFTCDENVQAAAARGVDLVGPVAGRTPDEDGGALTVDDFAWDERTGAIDACPAGHQPTSHSYDAATATTRIEMPASACTACPFRQQCPIGKTKSDKFILAFTDKERRLAARRVEEKTEVFKQRYARRSGIESTNSGLKNRLGLRRLPVRGRGSVFRVILHKVTGWNVLRAAATQTMRAWVRDKMAETLKGGGSGPAVGPCPPISRPLDLVSAVSWDSYGGSYGLGTLCTA